MGHTMEHNIGHYIQSLTSACRLRRPSRLLLISTSFVEGKVEWFRGMGLIPQGKYLKLC